MAMSEWMGVMAAVAEKVAYVALPDAKLAEFDPAAYVTAYTACLSNRTECVREVSGLIERAMGVARVEGVEEWPRVVAARGYAETVVNSVLDKTRSLYVDGAEVASVAKACVTEPADCVKRGKHWAKNRAKRARRQRVSSERSSQGSGVGAVENELKDQLRKAYDKRRVIENELAECRAREELELLNDPVLAEMRRDAVRKKAMGQAAVAACKASKSLSDLEAIKPGSSASQHEVREMTERMRSVERLNLELESALRKVDEPEARRIMQGAVRKAAGFGIGIDATRRSLGKAGPGETYVNADGETIVACTLCGEDCTCSDEDY